MQSYDRVWISSEAQLRALAEAYGRASLFSRLLGRFSFPEGTAHLRGVLMPWMRAPLVYTSQGALTVSSDHVAFRAHRPFIFGTVLKGVNEALAFDLTREDVIAVEEYRFSSPFAAFFDIPFTRVRTRLTSAAADFLICAASLVSPASTRARSAALRSDLLRFAQGRSASAIGVANAGERQNQPDGGVHE